MEKTERCSLFSGSCFKCAAGARIGFPTIWNETMSHVRKGHLAATGEWRKHLRFLKRKFWKRERQAAKRDISGERGAGRLIRERPND